MIRAILFDLDETLLDRTASLVTFLADQYGRFRSELGDVPFDEWRERFLSLDARGSVHKSAVYPELLSEFGGAADAVEALLRDYSETCCRHAKPFAGMAKTLSDLRDRSLRLGIVTNGETAFQNRHIEVLGLDRLVDTVLISQSEGLRKPDPVLFRRAAAKLGVTAADCVFVGDNPSTDVLGAHAAGMKTVWFRSGQEWPEGLPPNPGPAIDYLPELLDHLNQCNVPERLRNEFPPRATTGQRAMAQI